MNKPKAKDYATDDDLTWFKLENYAGLKTKATDKSPNYRLWSTVIRDRVEVAKWIKAGQLDYITPHFEKLKSNPLEPLGFDQKYNGENHSTNTPTVKLITSNRVKWLNEAMLASQCALIEVPALRLTRIIPKRHSFR